MRIDQRKNRAKQLAWAALSFSLLLITLVIAAQPNQKKKFKKPLTKRPVVKGAAKDTIPLKIISDSTVRIPLKKFSDSLRKKDTPIVVVDTFSLDNISKDSLSSPIEYSAEDSGVLDIPGKKFLLYGKANAKYETMDITAAVIELDNQKQLAKAYGVLDTSGITVGSPVMIDGDMTSSSDSVMFNMKTQKGLSKKTITKQGEMYVYAERIKKISTNEFFAWKGRFTTCNLDTPHFAFRTNKMKLVNNKWAYTGLTYPEIEGIPIPIGIPFGIFPLSQGRHSGFLAPSFSATQYFGYGLEGLGYYKVLSEFLDVTVRTNIYSYGGHMVNIVPTYRKRYRYSGSLNVTYQHTKFNFKGDPDYSVGNTYSLGWNHSMDSKARPGVTFGANVNISSSKFNQSIANNPIANYTNTLTSAIQYSKSWKQGKYNLQASATHSQNNNLHLYNINLPNLNFNAATFFPFKKEERIGEEKWYEKFGISYSGQVQNQFAFYDTINYRETRGKSLISHLLDTAQWGATHSIPITLALPSMGVFQVSPGISYSERWFGQKILHSWNPVTKRLDTLQTRGFFATRQASASLGIQTGIFGTFNFKGKNLVAIRHTIRPNISLNYTPDLTKKFYYQSQVDSFGTKLTFNAISGGPQTPPGPFGGMSFGINQQIEAKVKDKSDTSGKATKKIRLLDNLSINSGYNFFAQGDTNKLSDISIYMGTTLFDKISITASTSLIPYELNKFGQRTRRYAWSGDHFKLGNINNASLSLSTSLQSKKKEDKKAAEEQTHKDNDYYNPEEDYRQQEYIRNHPAEFTDFNIPWTLSLSFSLNINKQPKPDYSGFTSTTSANLNLSGDFSLSPKWKLGGSGFVDARKLSIEQFSMFISREMHCWQLSINVTPVGLYPSFNISFNPKSGILRDLKINRTRTFQTIL
ncbi:MAG: putative LPS assembly protein LptD [Chitinophagaceae bacterium]